MEHPVADVRRATAQDLDVLVQMAQAMHQESPRYREMRFDAAKLHALVTNLHHAESAALFVAQEDGHPIGLAGVVATERWFGPDRYVTDLGLYVSPVHRGGGAFPLLVLAVEAWAREQGVQQIDLGVSTGVQAERTVRAYERMGYTVADTRVVTKKLDHVHRS